MSYSDWRHPALVGSAGSDAQVVIPNSWRLAQLKGKQPDPVIVLRSAMRARTGNPNARVEELPLSDDKVGCWTATLEDARTAGIPICITTSCDHTH
jgi:hypothetical protein